MDIVAIGDAHNLDLKTIAFAYVSLHSKAHYRTGGYKFCPKDLDSAVSICELETMLSVLERPNIQKQIAAKNQLKYLLTSTSFL